MRFLEEVGGCLAMLALSDWEIILACTPGRRGLEGAGWLAIRNLAAKSGALAFAREGEVWKELYVYQLATAKSWPLAFARKERSGRICMSINKQHLNPDLWHLLGKERFGRSCMSINKQQLNPDLWHLLGKERFGRSCMSINKQHLIPDLWHLLGKERFGRSCMSINKQQIL